MSQASVSSASICAEQNARPTDQPASDQTTDQSAVNRAILMSLDRLNDNFACFSQQYDDELVDSESVLLEEQADNPVNLDIQADIDSLIQPCEHLGDHTGVLNTNANETDILQYDKQLDLNIDVQGPPINEKISNVVDKLRLQRISQDQAKAIMKRHNTPENVQLRLPKCEPTIWNEIPGKARSTDLKFQTIQAALLGAINCQLDVANSLLSANVSKDVLTSCLDGITLAMTANFDRNQRRRDAIRPHFKYEFAKGLCSSTSPADKFLFGGDTAKRVKEMAELTKHKVCKGSSTGFRGRPQRFHPYSMRGSRGISSRARSHRGYVFQPGFQQRQNFLNAPQSERKASIPKLARHWYVDLLHDIRSLISNQSPFIAGNTKNFVSKWKELTSDPEILDYVRHCHIEFTEDPTLYSQHGPHQFNVEQQNNISIEVDKLLKLGVISKSVHVEGECISPIFALPKPDGSYRLIFNFKHCNQAVLYRHFKMDTLTAILNLVTPGCYMASIDLKHAYYTIPIAQEQQKFLKFVWNDQLYEFTTLPMGLSSSPRIFTKVMKPVLAKLRQKGHINSGFIDDFYLQGQEISHCTVNLSDTVRLFIALGLHVHPDKCILIPSQEILMLGFLINSLLMTVKLPLEKKERLRDLCMQILHGTRFTIQCIAKLVDHLFLPFRVLNLADYTIAILSGTKSML